MPALVVSNPSGVRLEAYLTEGERDSGAISVSGAAAHLIAPGEEVIIMGFELTADPLLPKVVDWQNRVVRDLVEVPLESADTLG
ncbi:MAG TPA: aspartate 1-decarboxylase [Phenylobacterium sp.]